MARKIIFTLIFIIGTISVSLAQDVKQNLASMYNDGANIVWNIAAQNDGGTLSISTPKGNVVRSEFIAGGSPTFSAATLGGAEISDGLYNYEIILNPRLSPSVITALTAARAENRGEEVYKNFLKSGVIPAPMITSGSFSIVNGLIYSAGSGAEPESVKQTTTASTETPVNRTDAGAANSGDVPPDNVVVVNDDQVVLGSQCVGVDCPLAPAFGFDTLRLSENNLRINFEDTSSTSTFPTSDWRIVANDTTDGGASYLAFEDVDAGTQPFRVDANAGANALVVSGSSGRIGLGTLTPVTHLHMLDGNTPTMRLEQNGSSGFAPQTWDVAGNEANFFIRDVTNGSSLPFKIRPGAPTDALVITNTGNIETNRSFVIKSGTTGGITFADGSVQTTAGAGSGETNTASNVGAAGEGVFKQKTGVDLEFKKLLGGTNVTVTPTGTDELQISTTAQDNTASNIGAVGVGVFKQKTGANLEFKKLQSGSNITVSETANNEIRFDATVGETNSASNVGTNGVGVFKQKVGADLQFKKLLAGTNVTITGTTNDEIKIDAGGTSFLGPAFSTHLMPGNGSILPGFTSAAVVDPSTSSLTVTPGGGTTIVRFNIAGSPNLADSTAANTVFKIRYIDTDGAGSNARIQVSAVKSSIDSGARTEDVVFDSNTFGATNRGYVTVVVCRPGNSLFNFTSDSTWMTATLTTNAGNTASLAHVQIYKSNMCP